MTRRSINEIETTLRKAALGAGWPLGLAEDAGRSGAWLAATGGDGVRLCVEALSQPMPEPPTFDQNDDGLMIEAPTNGLWLGPAAGDCLCAGTAGGDVPTITARTVLMPLLCVPPVAVASRALNTTLTVSCNGNTFLCTPDGVLSAETWPVIDPVAPVTIRPGGSIASMHENFTLRYHQSLENGVDVDDTVWTCAVGYAAQTMVPASENSRQAGAGAGAIDNE